MKIHFLLFFVLILCSCDKKYESVPVVVEASKTTKELHKMIRDYLPFDDKTDFERADKGFIATREDPIIKNEDGTEAMNLDAFNFVSGEAPSTVNPSLWRQSELNSKHGLYKVMDGIYQVRGFDLANVTFIESSSGWIVVDPLTTNATAKAALDLVTKHLGDKPIKAVLITHSHIDHFGGIKGMISEQDVDNGKVEIIAPEGFYESSINENVIAGNGMIRRATYMYGSLLSTDSIGMVGNGLGQKVGSGQYGILPPTTVIHETGQKLTIDGVEIIFQYTPEAEAPAEFMFYLPQFKAFCQAEEINHTLHNLYTLRGAQVRNGLKWSKYIDQTIQLFGSNVDVSFGSHHWPTWGSEDVLELWSKQRDLYKYIHDQTLYLANNGYTMNEIADMVKLPESLDKFFANRGYYGTVSHNAKAQYQLYYGWFDGNPANLNALPPAEESMHYVEYMGGSAAIIEKVKIDIDKGHLRWAATALNHVVFAEPNNQTARELLAEVYTLMGYGAESGPWRNFYLTGASELRSGIKAELLKKSSMSTSTDILTNMSLEMFYDYMAVRLDRSKTANKNLIFNLVFPDIGESISLYLENDVLHNRPGVVSERANATITMNKSTFNDIITKKSTGLKKMLAGEIKIEGSKSDYSDFQNMTEQPFNLLFNIIEP